MNKLVLKDNGSISSKENTYYQIIGLVCSVFTLGLIFLLFYGFFFSRQHYHNRKLFLHYIKNNKLQTPHFAYSVCNYTWDIDGYKICLNQNNKDWFIIDGNCCVLSFFIADYYDRKTYEYILNELIKSSKGYKFE